MNTKQRILCQVTGTTQIGKRMSLVRWLDGERVIKTKYVPGDDAAHDFMVEHGLLATALLRNDRNGELWEVEAAPDSDDIDSGNDESALDAYARIDAENNPSAVL